MQGRGIRQLGQPDKVGATGKFFGCLAQAGDLDGAIEMSQVPFSGVARKNTVEVIKG